MVFTQGKGNWSYGSDRADVKISNSPRSTGADDTTTSEEERVLMNFSTYLLYIGGQL